MPRKVSYQGVAGTEEGDTSEMSLSSEVTVKKINSQEGNQARYEDRLQSKKRRENGKSVDRPISVI